MDQKVLDLDCNSAANSNNADEIVLPGFRFHPTDEELVTFYLLRKVQQRPLSIELIKQLDIYKFDPWDLPKMATIGEKEWYFYCPRDRKYRNSNRPNRVTGAGFWKATGTDRPIYSSDGTKCIGLKKSLVFYKGRAAKGVKTDWMMHEFRLPSLNATPCKRSLDKELPPNDSWAICRIFKKTTVAQRAPPHIWTPSVTMDPSAGYMTSCLDCNHNEISVSSQIAGNEFSGYPTQEEDQHQALYGTSFRAPTVSSGIRAAVCMPSIDFGTGVDLDFNCSNDNNNKSSTISFGDCMMMMSTMNGNVQADVPISISKAGMTNDNDSGSPGDASPEVSVHSHFNSSEDVLKRATADILANPLNFQSSHHHLYEILKGHVSPATWEISTSSLS